MVPLPIVSGHGAARLRERWFSVTGLNKIWVQEFIGTRGIFNFSLLITDSILFRIFKGNPKLDLLIHMARNMQNRLRKWQMDRWILTLIWSPLSFLWPPTALQELLMVLFVPKNTWFVVVDDEGLPCYLIQSSSQIYILV